MYIISTVYVLCIKAYISHAFYFHIFTVIKSNEITGCRKVVKKHKIFFTEHVVASVDDLAKSLQHSCIVNTDVSFVESGTVYLVSAYCEVRWVKCLYTVCSFKCLFNL